MKVHARAFAEIDVCPRCGGAFLDAGEGVMVHGTEAEPEMLEADGRATDTGRRELRCPARHARGAPAKMEVWEVAAGDEKVEVDWCRACGGFFLDAGEGVALLELAERTEELIRSETGAAFAPPPPDAAASVVDAYREEKGRSFFGELAKGLVSSSLRYRRLRRRRHHCDVDTVFEDGWRW